MGDVAYLTDDPLRKSTGVLVAFSERTGGVSEPPYASLDLGAGSGDDPGAVDRNRTIWLEALGIGGLRDRLTTAEQVHGAEVVQVAAAEAGAGAFASHGPPRVPGTDALVTLEPGIPLMLLFADCVPVVLVAKRPTRAVCVVHAGWRGALADLPGKAAGVLSEKTGCAPGDLLAYVGPHIRACHYEVGDEVLSRFRERFATMRAAEGRLDLSMAVRESLDRAGVDPLSIAETGECTAEATGRFFSYRAEGRTGRHAATAVLLDTYE